MKKLMLLCIGCLLVLSSVTASPIVIESNKEKSVSSYNTFDPGMANVMRAAMMDATYYSKGVFYQHSLLNHYSLALSKHLFYDVYKPTYIRMAHKLNFYVDESTIRPSEYPIVILPIIIDGPQPEPYVDPRPIDVTRDIVDIIEKNGPINDL